MAECERLLRAAGEMSAEATRSKAPWPRRSKSWNVIWCRLPTVAHSEAQRIRQMVQSETEQMLDLSARTISTIHARARPEPRPLSAAATPGERRRRKRWLERPGAQTHPARQARRRSARRYPEPATASGKNWEMKKLLAAVETRSGPAADGRAAPRRWARWKWRWPTWRWIWKASSAEPRPAMTIGNAIWPATAPCSPASWRAPSTTRRSTASPRSIARMNAFMTRRMPISSEFEALLARAREGDGGGLLTSTILSADTGKIYLAIAYALGGLGRAVMVARSRVTLRWQLSGKPFAACARVKAIHSALQLKRQRAQIALRRDPFAHARTLRPAADRARARIRDAHSENASICSSPSSRSSEQTANTSSAAGLHHRRAAFQNFIGAGSAGGHIGGALDPGQVGMAADGAGGGAGRVDQHERRGLRSTSRASLATKVAVRPVRARFSPIRASRAASRSTAMTCAPARRQLHGLAAGRGAKIDHFPARDIAQQQHRQGCGGILHPPIAVGKAGQVFDAAGCRQPAGFAEQSDRCRETPKRRFSR